MTAAEAEARVQQIRDEANDPETAHALEDQLHEDVLQAIALDHPDPAALAKIALTTRQIRFVRWCA